MTVAPLAADTAGEEGAADDAGACDGGAADVAVADGLLLPPLHAAAMIEKASAKTASAGFERMVRYLVAVATGDPEPPRRSPLGSDARCRR